MAHNTFQSNDFQGGHDDDSVLAETYKPCTTLYVSTTTDTHTLLDLGPSSRISFVKATFINSLFNRKIIPHRDYECAFSYADRELEGDETLESCQIGDEATVNAVVWTVDLTLHKGLYQANEGASSKIGRDDEQKTKRSKRVRSALDLSDPDEDMEQSNLLLRLAPGARKRKVRFADEMDIVSPPPTPPHSPSTSKASGPQGYRVSGGLGQGDRTIPFHDPLVRDATKRAFPQTSFLEKLLPAKRLKPSLKSPPPFDIYTGQGKSIKPGYDSLGNLISKREVSRRELRGNNDLSSNSSTTIHRKLEFGSSPTTVHFTAQNSNPQPLTSDPLRAVRNTVYVRPPGTRPISTFLPPTSDPLPAVRNTVYTRPPGTRPTSKSLPSASFLGSLNPFRTTTTSLTDSHQPLFCASTEQPPSISSVSNFTSQTSFPLFKNPPLSHAPSTSEVLSLSDLLIKKHFSSQPPIAASKSILKPSSTLQPSDSPFSTQAPPSRLLQSLNSYFSPPSPSSPSSPSPSTLQSLNPYFTNASPPPPKYSPSQPIHTHNYNSPQLTKQSPMRSDYFQAASRKATPSESKHHPLHSLLPPPPPPPHVRIEPPSPTHSPNAHRPPPADFSDRLQAEPPSNTNLNDKPQSAAPTRQPPPPPPLQRSPRLHTPSPSPSPPPSLAQKPYKLSHIPLFYKYDTLPPSQPPPPPPQSSLPTPEPTPPIPSSEPTDPPPITPAKLSSKSDPKPTYYSPLHPLSKDFRFKGAVFIPSLAHEILSEEFLTCRTVKQLIKLQGWEMSEREWLAVREVLENCKQGEKGARGNLEVLIREMHEIEELWKKGDSEC